MSISTDFDSGDDQEMLERHEKRIVRCRSCRGMIIWFETPAGKKMPVDADTVDPEDDELLIGKHISHFATCPDSRKWRKC